MDLNSTNGTFVNSKRISNHVLIHDDVVTLGHHRIKFHDPCATSRGELAGEEFADTAIMKTLEDMRNLLARENTALLPIVTEDLPTIQT
jgi:pSer/pThr/pTyr-binding forkhead associated (FHA) protein